MKLFNSVITEHISFILIILLYSSSTVRAQHRVYTDVESALKNPLDVYEINLNPNYLPDSILNAKRNPNVLYTYTSKGYRINSLSDSLVKCINLKTLKLSNNNFTEIPEVVYKLTSLEELEIDIMGIQEVSPEIKNLINLKKLSLSSAGLKELPKEIGDLKNLVELNIGENELEDLPIEFNKLSQLRVLDISENRFRKFPDCIKELTMLTKIVLLQLKYFDFNDTLNSLCSLKNLKAVYLGYNKLTFFPPWVLCCTNLEDLDMPDVSFTTFPSDISKLKKLKFLFVVNYDFKISGLEKRKVRERIPWCKHINIQ